MSAAQITRPAVATSGRRARKVNANPSSSVNVGLDSAWPSEKSCRNLRAGNLTPQEMLRAQFSDMLWQAFPADSMTACSEAAAEEMTRRGYPITARQVRYWLKCECEAGFCAVNLVQHILHERRMRTLDGLA